MYYDKQLLIVQVENVNTKAIEFVNSLTKLPVVDVVIHFCIQEVKVLFESKSLLFHPLIYISLHLKQTLYTSSVLSVIY